MPPIRFGEGFWLWLGVLLGLVFALRLGLGFGAVQHPAVSPGHQCHRVTGVRAEHGARQAGSRTGTPPGRLRCWRPAGAAGCWRGGGDARAGSALYRPPPAQPRLPAPAGGRGAAGSSPPPPRSPPLLTLPRTAPRSGRPHAWAPLPPPTPAGAPPRATTGQGLAGIPPISGGAASPPR